MFIEYACGEVVDFFLRRLISTLMDDSGFVIQLKSGNWIRDCNFIAANVKPLFNISHLFIFFLFQFK